MSVQLVKSWVMRSDRERGRKEPSSFKVLQEGGIMNFFFFLISSYFPFFLRHNRGHCFVLCIVIVGNIGFAGLLICNVM